MESLDPNEVWQRGNTYNMAIPRIGPLFPGDRSPSIIPSNGGRSGVEYYLCSRDKIFDILNDPDSEWQRISGMESKMIIGPKGQIECELLSSGRPIEGSVDGSTLNKMYLDETIPEKTGLSPDTGLAEEPEPEKVAEPVKKDKARAAGDPGPAPSK